MIATTTLLSELEARAGEGAVRDGMEASGWAVAGVTPRAVVRPPTVEAVAAVLAFCSEAGLPVEPAGAGTWLAAGRRPGQPPVVLSTALLADVIEYEPADLVIGVQAGMPHDELERRLAENGQSLPLDPPRLPGATIGATVALGAAGPLRAQHRTPRDLLLGVQVVTGDGRILSFGGRVVKNVAGYDLVRLLAGSRGTLGVITSMFLLLRSSAPAERTYRLAASGAPAAAALALAVRNRMEPEAVEVVADGGPAGLWGVLVRLAGSEAGLEEQVKRLQDMGPAEAVAARDVWRDLSESEAQAGTCIRLAGRPADLAHTVERAAELARTAAGVSIQAGAPGPGGAPSAALPPGWRLAAHGADGIVRIWVDAQGPEPEPTRLGEAIRREAGRLTPRSGSLLCPVLPDALRDIEPAGPQDARVAEIVAGLRRTFDPAGIMSPGRHGS